MRGAGCTINDMWDRRYDRMVERTKLRPLASGEVSMPQATVFLGSQLAAGLGVLLTLPWKAIWIGAASMPLVILYPLAKRVTYLPQLVLGLTFNWGVWVGYAATAVATGTGLWSGTGLACVPLYVGGVLWTLLYDTIYAHQDKTDDIRVGVKSSALLFEKMNASKPALSCFAAGMTACWAAVGYCTDASFLYYTAVAACASHAAWQIRTVNLDSREDCSAKFVSNQWIGWMLLGGIIADRMYRGGTRRNKDATSDATTQP
jgi:4-hydroxybenzoate polyprenyltransferase